MTEITPDMITTAASLPLGDNDADATTVADYLRKLLAEVWREGEGFSGKRPFGNSSWEYELYVPLVKAGLIAGNLDGDGYIQDVDTGAGNAVVAAIIERLDVAGAKGKPEAVRRLTVVGSSHNYGTDCKLLADNWQRDDKGGLVVTSNRLVVAEFEPGWGGVIDEAHRDPDMLKVARDGLSEITYVIRSLPLAAGDDHDCPLTTVLKRIREIADKAHAASYQHDGDPF